MDADSYRDALARHAAGVAVVSSALDGAFRGLTATSFSSLSVEPRLVLVCLDTFTATREAVEARGAFNLSLLERSQEFIADRFAGRAPQVDPGWREVPHRLGANRLPIVEGAIAWFECELDRLVPGGDHDIAIGRVVQAGVAAGEPLLLWDRSFWRLA